MKKSLKDALGIKPTFIQTIKDIALKAYVIGTALVVFSALVFYFGAQWGQAHAADNSMNVHNNVQAAKTSK